MEKGYAIQLLTIKEDHTYELNEKDLERVLLRDEIKDTPLVVISVVGAFRGGKSFLLNFFLKYLYSTYVRVLLRDGIKDTPVVVISVVGTFRGGKSFLLNFFLRYLYSTVKLLEAARADGTWIDDDSQNLTGFSWRGGSERNTTGILIWSEPTVVTLPSGEKVAVVLLDTQGTFDNSSTVKDNTTIVTLSGLLSSTQIYNIKSHIKEDDLQYLQLFTDIGKTMKSKEGQGDRAMQELKFLIRDWMNDWEFNYGEAGGELYLASKLKIEPSMPLELRQLHEDIISSFTKVSCFLMPHPGLKTTKSTFKGKPSEISEDFLDEVKELVHSIFDPERLCVKRVSGQPVNGSNLLSIFKSYAAIVNSDTSPAVTSFAQIMTKAGFLVASNQIREQFEKNMALACGPDAPSMPAAEVVDLHQQEVNRARDAFKAKILFGDQEEIDTLIRDLMKELTDRQNNFIEVNKAKTLKAMENGYAAYDKVLEDVTKGADLCVHDIDLSEIQNDAIAAALKTFNNNRKLGLDGKDADKDKFEYDLSEKSELLRIKNRNNNRTMVNVLKAKHFEYMMQQLNSARNQCIPLDKEHEAAKGRAIKEFESKRNKPDSYGTDIYKSELLQGIEIHYLRVQKMNTSANDALFTSALSTFYQLSKRLTDFYYKCYSPHQLETMHINAKKDAIGSIYPKKICGDNMTLLYRMMEEHYQMIKLANDTMNQRVVDVAYSKYRVKFYNLSNHWYWSFQSWSTARRYHNEAFSLAEDTFDSRHYNSSYKYSNYDKYWEDLKWKCDNYFRNL